MHMAQDLLMMTTMMDHQVVMTQATTTAATRKGITLRLVRDKKGSERPPDTPSELWYHYSQDQRAVKSSCTGNVCAGNQGMRLQLCP